MLDLNSVMIGTMQVKDMVAFYDGLFGRPPDMSMPEQGFWGWQAGKSYFSVLQHSEMGGKARDAGRILLNFETGDVSKEFERLKALGATVVREPYQMGTGWLATLADPDGNYFQLVTPM